METFNKLAGVQEASDVTEPTRQLSRADLPSAPPIPNDPSQPMDYSDARSTHSGVGGNRSSLPLRRRASHRSFRSKKSTATSRANSLYNPSESVPPTPHLPPDMILPRPSADGTTHEAQPGDEGMEEGEEEEEDDEDFPWGPSHPCFPHPNPHCHPRSPEASLTRVIRVRRDWLASGDLYPQYANLYPEILDSCVSDTEFRYLISNINAILRKSLSPYSTRAWIDSLIGVATGYLWEDLGWTGAKAGEKALERFIARWNRERESEGREVKLVQLRTTGFMSMDFVIADPGVDSPDYEDEEEVA
ncbi:uncharacterized protein RCC_07096 [Ramularia collo-cygni]|uniref:Ras modification protein ERF4 n=1 Tax=Ramularia collo-cygni TaxID=112498 RepID=A0A2D3VJU5_9PEZI|nr:uncharacterized protein RCC_07096 [Ramularia collo-cygni]CZT21233.1 uncharacterized protein RCC_07096 [Ramularia collo-cygni]